MVQRELLQQQIMFFFQCLNYIYSAKQCKSSCEGRVDFLLILAKVEKMVRREEHNFLAVCRNILLFY
jgi:hypothetical protein